MSVLAYIKTMFVEMMKLCICRFLNSIFYHGSASFRHTNNRICLVIMTGRIHLVMSKLFIAVLESLTPAKSSIPH